MHKIFANSLFIGKKIEILPHCHSTNQVAADLLVNGEPPEGTIVLTHNQTSGKGQRGNQWESEPGKNLTFSVILRPQFLMIKDQFYLNMIISLAMAEYASGELGTKVKVKWPNDIYVGDRKICGILIENSIRGNLIENTVVGIGFNVNQVEFEVDKATSLAELTLEDYDLMNVLESIIRSVEKYYLKLRSGKFDEIRKEYLSNLYWLNETHLFGADRVFSGQIVDIDAFGKLVIESNNERSTYDIKEIAFIE